MNKGQVKASAPPGRSQKRRRPELLAARVTSSELADVRSAAIRSGVSVSKYVRDLVLPAAEKPA